MSEIQPGKTGHVREDGFMWLWGQYHSPEAFAHRQAYPRRPEIKARQKARQQSPESREVAAQYAQTVDGKVIRANAQAKHLTTRLGWATQARCSMVLSSKKRGHPEPTLTKKWLLAKLAACEGHCPCCHTEFSLEPTGDGKKQPRRPSPDRLDASVGYTEENVVIICWDCNRRRGRLTIAEAAQKFQDTAGFYRSILH